MRNGRGWVGWMAVALLLVSAAPARAIGIGWLEKLSGPGPFAGISWVTVPLWCRDGESARVWCLADKARQRGTLSVNLSFTTSRSQENELQYERSDAADPPNVDIHSLDLSVDYEVFRGVDLGVALGANRFSGDRFESFTRFSIGPEIEVRPLAFGRHAWPDSAQVSQVGPFRVRPDDLLHVRARWRYYPAGFDAADFGSNGGFHVDSDWQLEVSIGIGFGGLW